MFTVEVRCGDNEPNRLIKVRSLNGYYSITKWKICQHLFDKKFKNRQHIY